MTTPHHHAAEDHASIGAETTPTDLKSALSYLRAYIQNDSSPHRGMMQIAFVMAEGDGIFSRDGIHNARVTARSLKQVLATGMITDGNLYETMRQVTNHLESKADIDEETRNIRRASSSAMRAVRLDAESGTPASTTEAAA